MLLNEVGRAVEDDITTEAKSIIDLIHLLYEKTRYSATKKLRAGFDE